MARRSGVVSTLVRMQREAERQRVRQARAAAQSQRAAAAARTRAAVQDQKLRARMYAEDRTREAADDTAQVEHQVEILQSVLAATLRVDDYLGPRGPRRNPRRTRYSTHSQSERLHHPPPQATSQSRARRPSGGCSPPRSMPLGPSSDRPSTNKPFTVTGPRRNSTRSGWKRRASNMTRTSPVRREEHRKQVEEVSALQRGLAARQPEAVVRYLDLVLEAAEYPDGFPHSWRLAYAAGSGHLAIEYELPRVDVVPTDKSYRYVKGYRHDHPDSPPG